MQQQNRLRKYRRLYARSLANPKVLVATLLVMIVSIVLCTPLARAADNPDQAAGLAAMRSKADECLSVAASQLRQHMYDDALATLRQCQTLADGLSEAQQRSLEAYQQRAAQGRDAVRNAQEALAAGQEYLTQGQLFQAQAEYQRAYALRKYLPEPQVKKIQEHLDEIKVRQGRLKDEMKALFKQSARQYRRDQFPQAREGFLAIAASGVKLGFFDRGGDFTDTHGYLQKIAKEMPSPQAQAPPKAVAAQTVTSETLAVSESDAIEAAPVENIDSYWSVTTEDDTEPASEELSAHELVEAVTPAEHPTSASRVSPPPARPAPAPASDTVEPEPKKKKFSFWPFGRDKEPSAEVLQKVSELLAQGDLAMRDGNSSLARQYFAEALELHPDSEAALRALAAADYDLTHPQAASPAPTRSILTRARAQARVQKEALEASFISTRTNIHRLLSENRFDQANAQVSQLLASTEAAKQLLGADAYKRIHGEARAMQQQIQLQQEEYAENVLKTQIQTAQASELDRQRKAEMARQEKIDGLFQRALAFRDAHEFDQGVGTLDRLLALDPQHKQATWMREDMEMMSMLAQQDEAQRIAYAEENKIFKEVRESAIPWSDRITYGDKDKYLENRRKRSVHEDQYAGSPAKRITLEKLDTVTIELDFVDAEFQQIINEIMEETDLKVLPSWANLEAGGILREDIITVQATNITVGAALDHILEEVSAGKWDVAGYVVDDQGFININAVSILGEDYQYDERVYLISDLLNLSSSVLASGGSGEGDTEEQSDELTEMIEDTVLPESWGTGTTTSGGRDEDKHARVRVSGNYLVVRQTRDGHRRIAALLKNLRASLSEQVTIEVRFLVITSNFLEDIGFDFDFYLNLGNAGYDLGPGSGDYGQRNLIQRSDPGPWNRTTPLPITQGGYDWVRPPGTGIPGYLGGDASVSAFQVAGSFLDNIQVDFLMRATQAHQRNRSLVAPSCTVISGESVSIGFTTTISYVSGWTIATDENVALPEPQVGTISPGVSFTITPTIIGENKDYVLLPFSVNQTTLLRIADFTYTTAGGAVTSLQLPEWANNTISTHVSVPDGGTLLMGGQKLTAEVEKEIGVPVLSKIPILNRIFSNRSVQRDDSVLLILIKPTIILQSEEEEKNFGSL